MGPTFYIRISFILKETVVRGTHLLSIVNEACDGGLTEMEKMGHIADEGSISKL